MILGDKMSGIAVEPSTNGQYGGLEPNWAFYPAYWVPVQPLTLSGWSQIKAILYDSVNEEDMWKDIANWVSFKGKLLN